MNIETLINNSINMSVVGYDNKDNLELILRNMNINFNFIEDIKPYNLIRHLIEHNNEDNVTVIKVDNDPATITILKCILSKEEVSYRSALTQLTLMYKGKLILLLNSNINSLLDRTIQVTLN